MSADFFKSTFSGGDKTCVEVAHQHEHVLIRDSKDPDSPVISIPAEHWTAVLKMGIDAASGTVADVLAIAIHRDGSATITGHGVDLAYNPAEWEAFVKGAANGEFDRPAPSAATGSGARDGEFVAA
ncbi:DUF397 domain-containing protein [Nocardia sp. XZ_19_369]|uniref:DUF397 domain-containing protein n=1 Tax=Nocardia sp. XZ_19_369 TaxID=2769487 RepID=UPI00188EB7B5|nr:DUF397 domain-containing protein [Nocardia sp. XZ_19_369]